MAKNALRGKGSIELRHPGQGHGRRLQHHVIETQPASTPLLQVGVDLTLQLQQGFGIDLHLQIEMGNPGLALHHAFSDELPHGT